MAVGAGSSAEFFCSGRARSRCSPGGCCECIRRRRSSPPAPRAIRARDRCGLRTKPDPQVTAVERAARQVPAEIRVARTRRGQSVCGEAFVARSSRHLSCLSLGKSEMTMNLPDYDVISVRISFGYDGNTSILSLCTEAMSGANAYAVSPRTIWRAQSFRGRDTNQAVQGPTSGHALIGVRGGPATDAGGGRG